jgi:hypothetical protein
VSRADRAPVLETCRRVQCQTQAMRVDMVPARLVYGRPARGYYCARCARLLGGMKGLVRGQ